MLAEGWADVVVVLRNPEGFAALQHLTELGALDSATVIETALRAKNQSLGEAVKRRISNDGTYALTHSLIASLPVDELVTTNYDDLLERAAGC